MTRKKFLFCELSIIVVVIGILIANIFLNGGNKSHADAIHVAMDYYGTIDFEPGDTIADNAWLDLIKSELGYDVVIDYALPTSQYETKTNTVVAAGSISDILKININQFSMLNKAGMICDNLAEVFDKYASDGLKVALGWDETLKENSENFKKWVVDGKLTAIPKSTTIYSNCWVLYIRKDWLDIIKEDVPQTLEDIEVILRKFKENGLGKGLALNDEILYTNAGSPNFVFNAYGAYPSMFVEKDGKIDFGFLQSECKDALKRLRSWYQQGLIYSYFDTTKPDAIGQKVASGDIGMIYGDMSIPLWKLGSCMTTIEGSEFVCVPAVSLDGSTPTYVGIPSTGSEGYVVSKEFGHPECLVKMLNIYYEQMYGETGDFDRFSEFYEAFPCVIEPTDKNYNQYLQVKEALDNDRKQTDFNAFDYSTENESFKYFSLNGEGKSYYRNIKDYLCNGISGNGENWAITRIFYDYGDENGLTKLNGDKGYDCSFSVIDYYAKNNYIKINAYLGVDTESYSKYRRSLESEVSQMFKAVIKGDKPLSYFDEVVNKLRNGYAKNVLEEINMQGK